MPQRKMSGIKRRRPSESPTEKSTRQCYSKPKGVRQNPGGSRPSKRSLEDEEQHHNLNESFSEVAEDILVVQDGALLDDDDEEAWLDALEKGDLDDFGELKKEKDPSLMTARQKALNQRPGTCNRSFADEMHQGNIAKVEVMSEEDKRRKAEKNKIRKMLAAKKAEESQKNTIERLVKQQGVRSCKDRQKKVASSEGSSSPSQPDANKVPMIKYISKANLTLVCFPKHYRFPLTCVKEAVVKMRQLCAICGKPKKYNCSSTKTPLCSLDCYKHNLSKALP